MALHWKGYLCSFCPREDAHFFVPLTSPSVPHFSTLPYPNWFRFCLSFRFDLEYNQIVTSRKADTVPALGICAAYTLHITNLNDLWSAAGKRNKSIHTQNILSFQPHNFWMCPSLPIDCFPWQLPEQKSSWETCFFLSLLSVPVCHLCPRCGRGKNTASWCYLHLSWPCATFCSSLASALM